MSSEDFIEVTPDDSVVPVYLDPTPLVPSDMPNIMPTTLG